MSLLVNTFIDYVELIIRYLKPINGIDWHISSLPIPKKESRHIENLSDESFYYATIKMMPNRLLPFIYEYEYSYFI